MFALMASLLLAHAEPPPFEVEPVQIQDFQASLKDVRFKLDVDVTRHKGIPVRLRSVDYRVIINKTEVLDDSADLGNVKLRRDQTERLTIPVKASTADLLGLSVQSLLSGDIKVRLKGTAHARVLLLFPVELPFESDLVKLATGG
jgi:hypothetical protein